MMQKAIAEKGAIFAICREVLDEVLDTSELDEIATRLQEQTMLISARARRLVEENARVRRDQEECQREYDVLAAEHEKLSQQMQEVEIQRKDKAERRQRIEVFLRILEEQEECVTFDPYTFVALVDKIVVGQNKKLGIKFRNGMKYEFDRGDEDLEDAMSRYDEIQNAYQYLGKEATFYDGMITCSIPRRRPIWFFVFLFYTQDSKNGE